METVNTNKKKIGWNEEGREKVKVLCERYIIRASLD